MLWFVKQGAEGGHGGTVDVRLARFLELRHCFHSDHPHVFIFYCSPSNFLESILCFLSLIILLLLKP